MGCGVPNHGGGCEGSVETRERAEQVCEVADEVDGESESAPTVSLLLHNVGVNGGLDARVAAAQLPERWELTQRGLLSARASQGSSASRGTGRGPRVLQESALEGGTSAGARAHVRGSTAGGVRRTSTARPYHCARMSACQCAPLPLLLGARAPRRWVADVGPHQARAL